MPADWSPDELLSGTFAEDKEAARFPHGGAMLTVEEARAIVEAHTGRKVDDEVFENVDHFHFGPKVYGKDLVPGGIVAPGDPSYLVNKQTGELIAIGSAEAPEWSARLGRMRSVRG